MGAPFDRPGEPADNLQSYPVTPPQADAPWPPAGDWPPPPQPPDHTGAIPVSGGFPAVSGMPAPVSGPYGGGYGGAAPPSTHPGAQPLGPPIYPPPGRPGGFLGIWTNPAVIAGVMGTILLLVTALAIVAIRAGSTGVGERAGPPAAPETLGAATRPAESTAPTAAVTPTRGRSASSPAAAGTFLSGHLQLYQYAAQVDLDTAKRQHDIGKEDKSDLTWNTTSLDAENRAVVKVWAGADAPTAVGCTETLAQGQPSIHISVLDTDAVVCVRTSEGRVGALTFTKVTKTGAGQLYSVDFDYVVWKKADDQ